MLRLDGKISKLVGWIVGESACTQDACMVFGVNAVTFLTLSALSGTRAGGFWESVALLKVS